MNRDEIRDALKKVAKSISAHRCRSASKPRASGSSPRETEPRMLPLRRVHQLAELESQVGGVAIARDEQMNALRGFSSRHFVSQNAVLATHNCSTSLLMLSQPAHTPTHTLLRSLLTNCRTVERHETTTRGTPKGIDEKLFFSTDSKVPNTHEGETDTPQHKRYGKALKVGTKRTERGEKCRGKNEAEKHRMG